MAKTSEKKSNFSQDFKELEAIVDWFEGDDIELEEGLAKFERGLELAKRCKDRLDEAENRIVEIRAKFEDGGDGNQDSAGLEEGTEEEGGETDTRRLF